MNVLRSRTSSLTLEYLSNPHDDFSLIRIINKPKRGIGKASIEKLQKAAFDHRLHSMNI